MSIEKAILRLADAIKHLTEQRQTELEWSKSHSRFATKHDLHKMEYRIMSKISEFAEKQEAFNARVDVAIEGLTNDVSSLKAEIEALKESLEKGEISPEDQARLDALTARAEGIAARLEALDALTPPPALAD